MARLLISFLFSLTVLSGIYAQKLTYNTTRITSEPPHIDGIFNEKVWDTVEWSGDFIQRIPYEYKPPTQKTQFKIIYDDENLYIAIRCFDTSSDSIVKRMSRRDGFDGDWVEDSLYISKNILNPEDTLELIFYVHDDLSGIDPALLYAVFEQLNEEEDDDYDDFFDLIFIPGYNDENSYKAILPVKYISPGEYLFYSIFLVDKAGNANDIETNNYVDSNYVFEVAGEYDPDIEEPVITDITVSPKVVEPGDTVSIEIKALEEKSGVLTLFVYIRNTDGIEEEELLFDDWQITMKNDTFICASEYIVPQNATNGQWIIEYIEIYDHYLNAAYFEYNIDYADADFLVTGGQSYPNRPPTWVIRDINLTLNTGEILVYSIPDFIVADIDEDELSFSAIFSGAGLPSWMNFSNEELKLGLMPGENDGGNYTIYILASDPGGLKDSLEINIEVISYEGINNIIQNPEINIYPNPSAKNVNIDCPYSIKTVSIYDLNGKIIYNSSVNCNSTNIKNLEKGIYILKVVTEKLTFIERLVIQ